MKHWLYEDIFLLIFSQIIVCARISFPFDRVNFTFLLVFWATFSFWNNKKTHSNYSENKITSLVGLSCYPDTNQLIRAVCIPFSLRRKIIWIIVKRNPVLWYILILTKERLLFKARGMYWKTKLFYKHFYSERICARKYFV